MAFLSSSLHLVLIFQAAEGNYRRNTSLCFVLLEWPLPYHPYIGSATALPDIVISKSAPLAVLPPLNYSTRKTNLKLVLI